MSFLLDTNICSDFLRGNAVLASRFVQYGGRLHLSSVSLAELYAWAYKKEQPDRILAGIAGLLSIVSVLPFGADEARIQGRIRGVQLRKGISFNPIDLQIAATAMSNDLTLITHNTKDFIRIPALKLDDWLNRS